MARDATTHGPTLRRSLGLLLAFVAAKSLLVLMRASDSGAHVAISASTPLVLLHQDALVVLGWAALDMAICWLAVRVGWLRRATQLGLWGLYALLALYTAVNMPIALRLSTPLTHSMISAIGNALSVSIVKYITFANVGSALLVLAMAALPVLLPPLRRRAGAILAGALASVAFVGSAAANSVDTLGFHRNPVVALGLTTWKRWAPHQPSAAKASPKPLPTEGRALDLTALRGKAVGRNVIWVILESTGARYLGLFGHQPDPTPRLTQLAERAVVFESAHCAVPDSIRGLFSMLCSAEPRPYVEVGAYADGGVPCASIAAQLSGSGYRTALFHSGHFRYIGMSGVVQGRGFHELHDADSIRHEHENSFGIDDASTARQVLSFVDSVPKGQRFFAVYSPIAGHHPYKSPGPTLGSFPVQGELDSYLNDLYTGDVALGHIIDGIRERGLWEQTLWVIVGDHGQAFRQHPGNVGHTLFVYEENTHVPFVLVAPGLIQEQQRAPQQASLLDMAPTTLALLGLPVPSAYHGRPLLEPEPGFVRFMTDHDLLKAGLRHGRWKLLYESEHERARLFDVQLDPAESVDVSAREAARTALYRDHLLTWLSAAGAR